MLIKNLWVHKNTVLIIVVGYALLLAVLSLIPITGNVHRLGFSFDDKIYHSLAYFVFTVLLYVYTCKIQSANKMIVAFSIAVIYGIIIEVLQEMSSIDREAELFDVIANTLGSLIAVIVIQVKRGLKLK